MVVGGVPEEADVDEEHGAHPQAGEEQGEEYGRIMFWSAGLFTAAGGGEGRIGAVRGA